MYLGNYIAHCSKVKSPLWRQLYKTDEYNNRTKEPQGRTKLHEPKEHYPCALEPYPCGEWMLGEKLDENALPFRQHRSLSSSLWRDVQGEDEYQSEGAEEGEIDIDLHCVKVGQSAP